MFYMKDTTTMGEMHVDGRILNGISDNCLSRPPSLLKTYNVIPIKLLWMLSNVFKSNLSHLWKGAELLIAYNS